MAKIDDIKNHNEKLRLVDIRKKPDENQIPGSVRYDGEELETAQDLPFERDERVVLYCGSGNSCSRIAQTLRDRGFDNVEALEGGYAAYKDEGLPLEPITELKSL